MVVSVMWQDLHTTVWNQDWEFSLFEKSCNVNIHNHRKCDKYLNETISVINRISLYFMSHNIRHHYSEIEWEVENCEVYHKSKCGWVIRNSLSSSVNWYFWVSRYRIVNMKNMSSISCVWLAGSWHFLQMRQQFKAQLFSRQVMWWSSILRSTLPHLKQYLDL